MKNSPSFFPTALILSLFTVANLNVNGQLLSWNVDGWTSLDPMPATFVDPNMATGGFNVLNRVGVGATTLDANSFSSGTAAAPWNLTATFDESNKYISFFAEPADGFEMTVTGLTYAIRASNTAPNTGRWGYAIGGGDFVFSLDFTLVNSSSNPIATWDFEDFTTTQSVEFRFWGYGTVSVNNGGNPPAAGGRIRITNNASGDDLVLNGSTAAIPEPTTYLLVMVGVLGLVAISRRGRRLA